MKNWLYTWLQRQLVDSTRPGSSHSGSPRSGSPRDLFAMAGAVVGLTIASLSGSTAMAFESAVSDLSVSDLPIPNLSRLDLLLYNGFEMAKSETAGTDKKRQRTKGDGARSQQSSQRLQRLEDLFVPPGASGPKSTANSATRSSGRCRADEADTQALIPPQGYQG